MSKYYIRLLWQRENLLRQSVLWGPNILKFRTLVQRAYGLKMCSTYYNFHYYNPHHHYYQLNNYILWQRRRRIGYKKSLLTRSEIHKKVIAKKPSFELTKRNQPPCPWITGCFGYKRKRLLWINWRAPVAPPLKTKPIKIEFQSHV